MENVFTLNISRWGCDHLSTGGSASAQTLTDVALAMSKYAAILLF